MALWSFEQHTNRDFLFDFENGEHCTPAAPSCALLEQEFQPGPPQRSTIRTITCSTECANSFSASTSLSLSSSRVFGHSCKIKPPSPQDKNSTQYARIGRPLVHSARISTSSFTSNSIALFWPVQCLRVFLYQPWGTPDLVRRACPRRRRQR